MGKESYAKTVEIINEAESFINAKLNEETAFGGQKYQSLSDEQATNILAKVMPIIRGAVSEEKKMLLTYDRGEDVLQFVNSYQARSLMLHDL
jgi:rhamnose utilization protein RhaD (predicted bifunctional aldolase and dehydrogenase)